MSDKISFISKIKNKLFSTYGVIGIIVMAGFIVTFQFMDPAPSKTLTISTGGTSGAYFRFANEYKDLLKKKGITLHVINSKGSVDNVSRLESGQNVDLALVQGGIDGQSGNLTSLGSMYFEPLWVFYKGDETISTITQLKGKRIAYGADGSGTQALAKVILGQNKIDKYNSTFVNISGDKAVTEIAAGKIDVMFMVASPNSPLVKKLLNSKELKIMSFSRADAYTRLFPYLTVITLPEGAVDFSGNVPAKSIKLLATTANLVARKDLHPALVSLVLEATVAVHKKHGLFAARGQFPTAKLVGMPLNKSAARFSKYGVPFLQKYLPFWLATLLDRLKILLLPLIGLMLPLFKMMPPLYRWRIRRRIYSWYAELRSVDPELMKIPTEDVAKYLEKLEDMEEEVTRVEVPLSYTDEVYNLRMHIDMVRNELIKYRETGSTRGR